MFDQFDTKRIIIIGLFLILAFLVFAIIAFYLYPMINPNLDNQSAAIEVRKAQPGYYEFDFIKFGPAAVRRLNNKIDELENQLEDIDNNKEQRLATIDSLYRVTVEQEEQIARLEGQTQQENGSNSIFASSGGDLSGDPELQQISRSLLILDEDELGPILNRLSDAQLVRLYNASSNNRRAKLMRSLDPGKAALLLRRIMG